MSNIQPLLSIVTIYFVSVHLPHATMLPHSVLFFFFFNQYMVTLIFYEVRKLNWKPCIKYMSGAQKR